MHGQSIWMPPHLDYRCPHFHHPPFLRQMPFLLHPPIYPGLGQAPNNAGLHTWQLVRNPPVYVHYSPSTNKQNEKHNLRLKQNMTSSRSVNDNYANCAEDQLMTYRLSVEDAAASLVVLQFTFLVGLTLVSGQQRPRRRLLHRSHSNTSAMSVTDLLQINNQSAES